MRRVHPASSSHHQYTSSWGGAVPRGAVPGALLVRPQTSQLRVRGLADVALVRALSGVQPDVVPQRGRLAEATVAEAADERLVQSVDAHVGAKVAARVEAAVADNTSHAPQTGGRGGGRGGGAFTGVEIICREEELQTEL